MPAVASTMTVAPAPRRYCVVTPYYKEERILLERCLASVRRQSPPVDHIVVADGFPQAWVDALPVRHIKLDRAHADYGNAARGLGALMAIAEGYAGVAFLDADNWYDDNHLASCLAAAEGEPEAAYVIAQRRFCRPDASTIQGMPADYPHSEHVDTNCYLLLRDTFDLVHRWCTMPQELSTYGDQMFGKILRAAGLRSALVPERTVNYLCQSEAVYQQIGETPPPGCKPMIYWSNAQAWINALPETGRRHLERLTGLTMAQIDPPAVPAAPPQQPEPAHLDVEVPGSTRSARLRRSNEDVAAYKRIFIDGHYASAELPEQAALIVDAAAGIGLASLYLHTRYPEATLLAVEAAGDAFGVLAGNMDGRPGCSALRARVTVPPGRLPVDDAASPADPEGDCPTLTLTTLLRRFDGVSIDLLRIASEQWGDTSLFHLIALKQVRAVLIDGPDGAECIALPDPALANGITPPADPLPSPSLEAA